MQVVHLVGSRVLLQSYVILAVEKRHQGGSLEARVAHAVHAHTKCVFARTVRPLEEERTHAQSLHTLRHRLVRGDRNAPARQPHAMVVDIARLGRVLAAGKLNARRAARVRDQLFARLLLHDMARFHDRDTVAKTQRFVDVVAHVQDGAFERIEQAYEVLLQHAFEMRVERRERLVQHEDARPRRQHARKRHALLLAARQLRRIAPVETGQAEPLQLPFDDARPLVFRHVFADARAHVLFDRQVGKQHVVLEQQRGLALLRRQVHARFGIEENGIVHHDAAFVGTLDARDAAHGKAFAAS